jgi:hypothetical protein
MSVVFLDSEQIGDPLAREALEKISEVLNASPLLTGNLKVFEFDVTNTSTTIKIRHRFSFAPTDVWVSWVTNNATISIKYDEIDETFLAFTASAACKVRLIAGRIS